MNDRRHSIDRTRSHALARRPAPQGDRRRWFALALAALTLIAVFAAARPARAAVAPDKFVQQLTEKMLAELKADKAVQSGDQKRIGQLVDTNIMPNVNFERMTALSVGRGWRDASPAQREQLRKEFRALLLRTYSGAFAEVRDQTVRMRPFRGDAEKDNEVLVRTEIVQPRGEPIQLDYRLEKSGDGWKIFDVNVLGVWLVQTYRNQFAQEITSGGIDGLIKSLAEKNRSGAAESPPTKS
ncbi:MAG: ABC transporter substrate-binding protein [Burkholderiaceae bacterium]